MPRNNKTSNVLKLLNLKELPAVDNPQPVKVLQETEVQPPPEARRRKNITGHMKLEKLSEEAAENPALKAIGTGQEDGGPRSFTRPAAALAERQIVSVPVLLITEQLGAAVERFNSCACDECLRGITDKALDLMPPMYVRVVNDKDENEVNRLINERRPEAIRVLAKICIAANKKPFHDE
ncbi:MAG: hypothetical protein FWE74_02400 [Oscillospiraceae bacterium]|nr:hypothetical protein [Oscillospiraceae bacterium]